MKSKFSRIGAALLGCAAATVLSAGVATASPPDPHLPNITRNWCEGARMWGYICDGTKYADGSYWHQWEDSYTYHFDCVSGDEPFPAPPPPGGCDGAIPGGPPPPPA
ncbi:hypothetical protein [Mycobacterium montefiorense]|uniref:hypothetical protein n=1 Tax=Mycobacterium montefiorense TaxID=154654 RepID=UPI0021DC7E82|nr:hypothetical protein [Mycobacterium montefiorense]MCV7427593.1 hypothetical protein [Mycobacterium montefiorense]GLE50651.1 hypothetical protein ATCCBAA256_02390 [Mycobacterium montefiorense]